MFAAGNVLKGLAFRIILFAAFIGGLYLILGPQVCRVLAPGSGKHLVTLAKLNNLRFGMSQLTSQFYSNTSDFPSSMQELIGDLRKNLDMENLGDGEELAGAIYDGWGRKLRFQGDLTGYEIRSSGKDGIFGSEDDIYLKGNEDSENVFGGVRGKNLAPHDLRINWNMFPFHEPSGYYSITLPGLFQTIYEYDRSLSIITFQYTRTDFIRISAEAVRKIWDPAETMSAHIQSINDGRRNEYLGFQVDRSGFVEINGGKGYEIRRSSADTIVHEFAFTNGYELSVKVWIQLESKKRREVAAILERAIEKNLVLR